MRKGARDRDQFSSCLQRRRDQSNEGVHLEVKHEIKFSKGASQGIKSDEEKVCI